MVDLPDHDHCRYCGCAVPFEQAYCSMECYENDQKRIRKEKVRDTAMAVTAVVGAAVILVAGYVFGRISQPYVTDHTHYYNTTCD